VDATDAEVAADALWQARPSAVSEVALGAGRVRLTADVAQVELVDPRWGARVVEPDHDAHLDGWRTWASPRRAGRRIVVQPAWHDPDETPGRDLVVRVDPGRSFGSGSHASTRLVLALLEDRLRGGERVLDVGCGSGVLSVVACRLGAASATALDIDPAAVAATRANAAANGVAGQVEASTRAVAAQSGAFDVVVANIGLRVLCELAPALRARLAPDGVLVLAGLLDVQVDEVVAAYRDCAPLARLSEEGWAAVVLGS